MATAKFVERLKRKRLGPLGFSAKILIAVFLGLLFTVIWSTLSSPSSTVSDRRTSFGDFPEQAETNSKESRTPVNRTRTPPAILSTPATVNETDSSSNRSPPETQNGEENIENSEPEEINNETEVSDGEGTEREDNGNLETEEVGNEEEEANTDQESGEDGEDSVGEEKTDEDLNLGPQFDPKAHYSWKSCGAKKGPHFVPCIDLEVTGSGNFQGHRHHERSCPKPPSLCLVPLPGEYKPPVTWPESRSKVLLSLSLFRYLFPRSCFSDLILCSQILYPNVAHPMLSSYIKAHKWLRLDGKLLLFPRNESILPDGGSRYIDFIEEVSFS